MRCRLSPTADVPLHTSGAAMCHSMSVLSALVDRAVRPSGANTTEGQSRPAKVRISRPEATSHSLDGLVPDSTVRPSGEKAPVVKYLKSA